MARPGYAQTLTISTVGDTGPTSGTNWSLTGNTLTVTGTANINASVIETGLASGSLNIVGNSSSFSVTVSQAVTVASGGNSLVVGDVSNTGTITINSALSTNGAISLYGGIVTANQNLTSSASGASILLQANSYIVMAASRTIQTNGGDITFRSNAGGTANTSTHAIDLNAGCSLLSNGGNITLGGNFDGSEGTGLYAASNKSGGAAAIVLENVTITAAGGDIKIYGRSVSSYDDGILFYGNITTTGSGSIGFYGDAFGGYNGAFFGGITVWSATNIQSEDGNIELKGVLTNTQNTYTGAINFYRVEAIASNHISILSKTGDVQLIGDAGSTAAWGIGQSSGGHVYLGSPADGSWVATGDVSLVYSRFGGAASRGVKVRTTGSVSYLPVGTSFTAAETFPVTSNYTLAQDASGLTIGKAGNTGNVTIAAAQTIAGPISIYGNSLNIQADLASTLANASIKLVSDGAGATNNNGFILLNSSVDLTTNGGDILLWSNAANRTSGTANNEIVLAGTNILSSTGGKIVLAGGLDDNADGIPDGFAYRGGNAGEALDIRSNVTLDSDGGEIIIRGEQNGSAEGIVTDATFTIRDAGPITIEGKNTTNVSVRLGTSNISSTTANAPVSMLGTTHLTNSGLVTISTQGGDVLMASNTDDATDGESAINGQIRMQSGLSITTNGGDITLGGGNSTGSTYAIGQTSANIPEGIRIDGSLSLNSGGGDIALRGKTPAVAIGENIGAAGIMFYNMATGSINSGTGTVLLDGYSQTSGGNAIAGLLWWNPGAGTFTIESSNTTANAITMNGFSSGTSGQAFGIETEAFNTLTILATGAGGGITINTGNSVANYYDAVFRGPLNILAVDGPISLKGRQLGGVANGYLHFANNVYLGSKASTAVTSSASNILIEFDRFDFPAGARYIGTSGAVTWQPNAVSFSAAIATSWFSWNQNSQTMSGLTIGKMNSTANISQNVAITVAGPISMYGGGVDIAANLTSSANGDIFLKGNSMAQYGDLYIQPNITIAKSAGTGTFTAQAKSRIYNNGTITATGTGSLNVVLWSDYDNATTGGVSGSGTISTNGGHVWMGGSSTAQGSMTWNGLTVGDGPSVGSSIYNYSGLDLTGNITTAGGDVLIWAGDGNSAGESGIRSYGKVVNAGTGDVILITDYVNNLSGVTDIVTTGILTIAPNGNSFATSPFLWNPVVSGAYLDFPAGNFDPLRIQNAQNLTGLIIGRYAGTGLAGDTDFGVLNTSDITLSTEITIGGHVNIYGGAVTIGANITTNNSGDISIISDASLSVTGGTRTATADGMFKFLPNGTSFSAPVSYPNGSLIVNSNGLQLGKIGNTTGITISTATVSNGPVTIYSGDFTTDPGATLTATGSALEVNASGNVTLNAALSGSTTTINGQGNVETIGTLTNLNLLGGNAQSITGTATLTNLTLNKSAGMATINAGPQNLTGTLSLTAGTLAANGNLVLKSSSSGTARVAEHMSGTGNVTGNVVVERFIPGSRKMQWRMLAFPYNADLTLSNISGMKINYTTPQTMMYFRENLDDGVYGTGGTRNGGYETYTSSSQTIPPGRGIAAWVYGDESISATPGAGTLGAGGITVSSLGELNETGLDVTIPVSNVTAGWNLVANPFASTIDWHAVSGTNLSSVVYRWDPEAQAWTDYNTSGAFNGNGSRYIESGSAFFVKSAGSGAVALVIPQSAKVTNAPNMHFSKNPLKLDIPGQRVGNPSTLAGLRLKASGMGNPIPGEAYLDVSKTDATRGWDPQYDGLMMARTSGASVYFDGEKDIDFSMHFDQPLMNGEQRYYPITVTTPKAGETLIEVTPEGKWSSMHSVALIDQQLGRTILMRDGKLSYKLRLEELKSEGRFILAINHVKLSADGQSPAFEVKALGNPVTKSVIDLLISHPTASAKRWRVVDAAGRETGSGGFSANAGLQHRLTVPGMRNAGAYIVQVEMDNGETQQVRILKH